MKMDRTIRGAAAVGQLTDVSAWEAELILNMRLWQDGPRGQEQVWNAYATAFGPDAGRAELRTFERLLCLIDTDMLRPLVRPAFAELIAIQAAQVGTAVTELTRSHSTARDGLSDAPVTFH